MNNIVVKSILGNFNISIQIKIDQMIWLVLVQYQIRKTAESNLVRHIKMNKNVWRCSSRHIEKKLEKISGNHVCRIKWERWVYSENIDVNFTKITILGIIERFLPVNEENKLFNGVVLFEFHDPVRLTFFFVNH